MTDLYLNWGTLSKTWPAVFEKMQEYEKAAEVNPTQSLFEGWGRLWEVQKKVAGFFGARPQDFFFRHNVTAALNDFILGMDIRSGALAYTDLEYGAIVNIVRYRALREGRGLQVVKIPFGDELTQQIGTEPDCEDRLVDLILDQVPNSVRMLLISHVMTATGLKVPIARLAKKTRERGILLAVDGAHSAGTSSLDFRQLQDVDFYGGNLHKWMRGPKGTGFGWAPQRVHELMKPISAGWTTFETPLPFQPFGDGDRWATSMLMAYCLNFAPFFALADVVEIWNERGAERLLAELQNRREQIQEVVQKNFGWKLVSPEMRELQSPLVAFELPGNLAARGYSLISEIKQNTGVTVSIAPLKGSYVIRFSCHVDGTAAEIEAGLLRVGQFLAR